MSTAKASQDLGSVLHHQRDSFSTRQADSVSKPGSVAHGRTTCQSRLEPTRLPIEWRSLVTRLASIRCATQPALALVAVKYRLRTHTRMGADTNGFNRFPGSGADFNRCSPESGFASNIETSERIDEESSLNPLVSFDPKFRTRFRANEE